MFSKKKVNMNKKYVFIKPFKTNEGVIPEGSEIIIFRGNVYMNGGLLHPAYNNMIMNIINNPKLRKEYLIEMDIIPNKI